MLKIAEAKNDRMKHKSQSDTMLESLYETDESSRDICTDRATFILSIFYGILLINLAVVFTTARYVTSSAQPLELADYYLNILYIISILWLISFAISVRWGCNRADAEDPVKNHHASNHWLKGVVTIFGFSITIKDALDLIALTEVTNPFCEHRSLYILLPMLHGPFVCGQVIFLFLYSKHYIQECRHLTRFGIMHVMATNLSIWIITVASEARETFVNGVTQKQPSLLTEMPLLENTTRTATLPQDVGFDENNEPSDGLFHGNCTCSTTFCSKVVEADQFLYPFLIEFCLVSTSLLYVTWTKVGKKTKDHISVLKPSYRFYKAYKGLGLGVLLFAITITVIIILGTYSSDAAQKTYYTDYEFLYLYEGFLIISELLNLLACVLGFYLYMLAKKRSLRPGNVSLEIVLLFVCFIGPVFVGLFSILAIIEGDPDSKAPNWWISLTYPVVDILGMAVQISFIVFGQRFIPKSIAVAQTTSTLERDERRTLNENGVHKLEENKEITKCGTGTSSMSDASSVGETSFVMKQCPSCSDASASTNPCFEDENVGQAYDINSIKDASLTINDDTEMREVKTVAKIELGVPGSLRIALRDVIMFLVISNASIWVFLALDKTVFSTLTYQHLYFGHSTWTTLTAVTSPLSIFLRMHSAACFFEMWSYA